MMKENAILREKLVKLENPKKLEKLEKPKISRPISAFIYFKSHPDSQDAIMEASKQLQGEGDKKPGQPIGKVKGAGMVWSALSDDEKNIWKIRAQESVL